MALRQRLLRDVAEIKNQPYPNIELIIDEADLSDACLILRPNGDTPLHLTIEFPQNYPLKPPKITIQSDVEHPNVFHSYICASILNTTEGYTPAYTLKGICIQMLSFFSSDRIQQTYGAVVDLQTYKRHLLPSTRSFKCPHCSFDSTLYMSPSQLQSSGQFSLLDLIHNGGYLLSEVDEDLSTSTKVTVKMPDVSSLQLRSPAGRTKISDLPDELLSHICSFLEVEELAPFSQAWDRIGGATGVISNFNIIRNRELICFCLKKDFKESLLGIGVHTYGAGRYASLESEFDLLSLEAFSDHRIRRSVHNLTFQHWLPLPISRGHWRSVQEMASQHLRTIASVARYLLAASGPSVDVIYAFMTDIVVRLCSDAEKLEGEVTVRGPIGPSSTSLKQASEKAIESYYHLFHLLLCIVTDPSNRNVIRNVNRTLKSFLDGKTSKRDVPNLGHLLVMVLISDADMTVDLLKAIIRETITRNVVWVLDKRGANMAELSYMEADYVSTYRLQKTFEASLTSYRLLMFLNTFRRTINRGSRTLVQLRDSLFDAHGAPPHGTAAKLANDIKRIQQIKTFPNFLRVMGLPPPTASQFTKLLRDCVEDSMVKGYSVWGTTQEKALILRRQRDPNVEARKQEDQKPEWRGRTTMEADFFPNGRTHKTEDRTRARGAIRGRGRGRGW